MAITARDRIAAWLPAMTLGALTNTSIRRISAMMYGIPRRAVAPAAEGLHAGETGDGGGEIAAVDPAPDQHDTVRTMGLMAVQAGKNHVALASGGVGGHKLIGPVSAPAAMLIATCAPVDGTQIAAQAAAPDGVAAAVAVGAEAHIVRGLAAVRLTDPGRLPAGTRGVGGFVLIGTHKLALAPEAEMVAWLGDSRIQGKARLAARLVAFGQMGVVAGIAGVAFCAVPGIGTGLFAADKGVDVLEVVIGGQVEGRQNGLRTGAGGGAAEGGSVILVGHLLHRSQGVVAVKAEVVRLQIGLACLTAEIPGKKGMGAGPSTRRKRLGPVQAGVHLVAVAAVAPAVPCGRHGWPGDPDGGRTMGRAGIFAGRSRGGKKQTKQQRAQDHFSPAPGRGRTNPRNPGATRGTLREKSGHIHASILVAVADRAAVVGRVAGAGIGAGPLLVAPAHHGRVGRAVRPVAGDAGDHVRAQVDLGKVLVPGRHVLAGHRHQGVVGGVGRELPGIGDDHVVGMADPHRGAGHLLVEVAVAADALLTDGGGVQIIVAGVSACCPLIGVMPGGGRILLPVRILDAGHPPGIGRFQAKSSVHGRAQVAEPALVHARHHRAAAGMVLGHMAAHAATGRGIQPFVTISAAPGMGARRREETAVPDRNAVDVVAVLVPLVGHPEEVAPGQGRGGGTGGRVGGLYGVVNDGHPASPQGDDGLTAGVGMAAHAVGLEQPVVGDGLGADVARGVPAEGHGLAGLAVVHGVAVAARAAHRGAAGRTPGQQQGGNECGNNSAVHECSPGSAPENHDPAVALVHHAEPAPGVEAQLPGVIKVLAAVALAQKAVAENAVAVENQHRTLEMTPPARAGPCRLPCRPGPGKGSACSSGPAARSCCPPP